MKQERAEVASGSGGDVKSQKLAEQATEAGQQIDVKSKRASSGSSGGGGDVKSHELAEQAKEAGQQTEGLSKRASSGSSGGGGDAVIKSQKVAEGDKAEAGKVKKMWTVTEEYIHRLRKEKAAGGPKFRNFDYLNDNTGPYGDALRAIAAGGAAIIAGMEAHKAKILEEYDTHGHAQVEVAEDPWADNEIVRKVLARNKRLQQQQQASS